MKFVMKANFLVFIFRQRTTIPIKLFIVFGDFNSTHNWNDEQKNIRKNHKCYYIPF